MASNEGGNVVPAVGESRRRQPPHDHRPSLSRQATVSAQNGQEKPSGQRSQST